MLKLRSSFWPITIGYVTVTELLQTPFGWSLFGAGFCGFASFWIDKLWLGLYDEAKEEDNEGEDQE